MALLTLFIRDVIINLRYGAPLLDPQILIRYGALAIVGCLGFLLQSRASLKTLFPASIVGSTMFYVITNTFSWLSDPGYAKNFAGLIQSLTVGLPQTARHPAGFFSATHLSAIFRSRCFCGVYERGAKQGEIGSPRLAVRSGLPCSR